MRRNLTLTFSGAQQIPWLHTWRGAVFYDDQSNRYTMKFKDLNLKPGDKVNVAADIVKTNTSCYAMSRVKLKERM